MIAFRFSILYLLLFTCSLSAIAQTKEKLENDRKNLIKEIEKTTQFLEKTTQSKKTTIKDLKAIESQVDNRKKLISTIQTDITLSDKALTANMSKIDSLNKAMDILTKQYGGIIRYNYLQQLSNNKWSYLLSSKNLNAMMLRWRYMRQFEEFSKTKKDEIIALNAQILQSNQTINQTIEERKTLLKTEEVNKSTLEKELDKKNKVLQDISGKEAELKKELNKKKAEREKLNKAIENIILEELKKAKTRETTSPSLNTAAEKLSNTFSGNKGKLPWPMASGFVSAKFGTIPHPTIKGVNIENNGIDISTKGEQRVKAVFDGEVVGITKVPGSKNMIILRHGNYYSVYSNIDEVIVRKGDQITTSQLLGSTSPDENGVTELHFELWKDKTKLNPESWLK